MRRGAGFTLLEVLILLVIGMIIAGAAIPSVHSLDDQWLMKDAQILMADLEFVQARAIATGQNHRILFKTAVEKYRVESPPGVLLDEPLSKDSWVRVLDNDRGTGTKIKSADFDGEKAVIFDGGGRPDAGGNVVLKRGEFEAVIEVKPVTGEIVVTLP